MRADLWAVLLVLALPAAPQRGAVTGVAVKDSPAAAGVPVSITVTGSNPCGAVRLEYGDGSERVTHPISQVPATIQYTYARPGSYRIRAEGMGNCDGDAVATLEITQPRTEVAREAPEENRFREMDSNGDGVVTLTEWRGSARAFRTHDLNRDGVLSGEELRAPHAGRDELIVKATVRWTDTGVYVREGEQVRVASTGSVQLSRDSSDAGDASGVRSGRRAPGAPLASRPAGALIARVGDSPPVYVGGSPSFRAPASGQLYLGVNDDYLEDNRGQFHVKVEVGRR